jgi:predicted lipid-binding transport protein (Tim44 family)
MRAGTLLLLITLALVACGAGDEEDVEQTVRDFVEATNDQDAETFCDELLTQEFLERTTGAKGEAAQDECRRQTEAIKGLSVELVRIRKTEIDGARATVTAVIKTQGRPAHQTLRLEKEDGDWRLSGSTGD